MATEAAADGVALTQTLSSRASTCGGDLLERTQVFLTRAQKDFLVSEAKARSVSVSALVRAAVGEFIARQRREEWVRVLDEAFGSIPDLPDGEEYTRKIRDAWGRRTMERIAGL
jgi:post-segregation antitoxin (ccd killing protein)